MCFAIKFLLFVSRFCDFLMRSHAFQHSSTVDETMSDGVQHSVHIATTSWSAVQLGKFNELVYRHADRDVRECHHLGYGNLHDDHVHVSQAREIPVARSIAHISLILLTIQDGRTEELASKVTILSVLLLWQQLLVGLVVWVETLHGL